MKKKVLSILFLVLIIILMNSVQIFAAKTVDSENNIKITPYYTSIVLCYNNLQLNSDGKLSCEGRTNTQIKYTAGVKMEIQKLSDNWTTIKTWESTSDNEEMYLYKEWYVEKGSYRLKLTHTALDSSEKVVETVTKYSKTVVY